MPGLTAVALTALSALMACLAFITVLAET
ncbi:hypothetical protein ACD591_01130 [Rufibacter glacialis]|uniref:Uncharacterized protein n=1 Tax=Rufibacter glacialis TaxID=1259555 RepID=A0ABV4R9Z7_9BACT